MALFTTFIRLKFLGELSPNVSWCNDISCKFLIFRTPIVRHDKILESLKAKKNHSFQPDSRWSNKNHISIHRYTTLYMPTWSILSHAYDLVKYWVTPHSLYSKYIVKKKKLILYTTFSGCRKLSQDQQGTYSCSDISKYVIYRARVVLCYI